MRSCSGGANIAEAVSIQTVVSAPMVADHTKTRPRLVLCLKMGIMAASLATLVSSFIVAVLNSLGPFQRSTDFPGLRNVIESAILLCAITVVSCGLYGMVAGITGGAILSRRKHPIRSIRRLVIESGSLGLLLGILFPFFDLLMNPPSLSGMQALLSAPVGMLCAIVCALTFRTHLVTRTPSFP